jgi:hypothetical protein
VLLYAQIRSGADCALALGLPTTLQTGLVLEPHCKAKKSAESDKLLYNDKDKDYFDEFNRHLEVFWLYGGRPSACQ